MDKDFHVALIYQEPIITPDVIDGFEEAIQSPGLKVLVKAVPMMGVRAALEWLMPTAIVAYIAKPYFESFLGEMGKDHYKITKKVLQNLQARIQKRFGERLELVGSKGKLGKNMHIFSPVFSVEAQSPIGYRIKLLIQTNLEADYFDDAIGAYIAFLLEVYGIKEISEQSKLLLKNEPIGSVLLVCYNKEIGKLEYVNPIPKGKRP